MVAACPRLLHVHGCCARVDTIGEWSSRDDEELRNRHEGRDRAQRLRETPAER